MAIVSYTKEELKNTHSLTDWERVLSMKEEDIDMTDEDNPDVVEMLEKGYYKQIKQPKNICKKQPVAARFPRLVRQYALD